MADLTDKKQFEAWLETQPREVCVAIAARAVLRVLPVWFHDFAGGRNIGNWLGDVFLPVVRATALAWVAIKNLVADIEPRAIGYASHSSLAPSVAVSAARYAARIAAATDSAEAARLAARITNAATLATRDADGVVDLTHGAKLTAIATIADAQFIINGGSAESLAMMPLWLNGTPDWAHNLWDKLKDHLLFLDQNWDVWTRWYNARLEGLPSPGGEELDSYRVRLDSEEDWTKGPAHVNGMIKAKEQEIAGRTMSDGEMWAATQRSVGSPQIFSPTVRTTRHSFFETTSSPPLPLVVAAENERAIQNALDRLSGQTFRPSVVVRDNKLALDFVEGDQTVDPLAERMHPEVLKFARRLSGRAPRLMNSHKEAAEDSLGLLHLIDRPFEEVVGLDVEIWNFSLALGEHLQEDNLNQGRGDKSLRPRLEADDRRALEAVVARVGSWVRFFPNARRLDEEYRQFSAKPEAMDAVKAILTADEQRLEFLENSTKTLLLLALKTSGGTSEQAPKAKGLVVEGTKSLTRKGLVVSRRRLLGHLMAGAAFGTGKQVAEGIVDEFDLDAAIVKWLQNSASHIRRLFADFPTDLRQALDRLLRGLEGNPDDPDDGIDLLET